MADPVDFFETKATLKADVPVADYIALWLKTVEREIEQYGKPIQTGRLILTVGKTILMAGQPIDADAPPDDPLTVRVEFTNVGAAEIPQVAADINNWAKDRSRQDKTPLKTAVIDASLD